jgi:large subunit ribosomal protein L29
MKASELRDLSPEELAAKTEELRKELFGARIRHATGQLESPAVLCTLRRDIARAETVRTEKSKER